MAIFEGPLFRLNILVNNSEVVTVVVKHLNTC